MLTIDFLEDHLDTIPTLVKWFRNQWTEYYANSSDEAMQQDFLEDILRDRLPSRLVAFEGNELVGTIVLREGDAELSPEHHPELGGLYVAESHRGHGIGTELIKAGMKLAQDQGYSEISATTVKAAGILEGLGWKFIKKIQYPDGEVSLYHFKI
ncbi:MAG TPA: GNAT family N-acetyltransferase [Anaerolineales bacterium]|nr:GNAT family N-acetyltransferase [Anaerolineales bacterium]